MFRLTLVLSGIWCYLLSYLLDNKKCWNLTLKLTLLYHQFMLTKFLFILRKMLTMTKVLIFFNRNMNLASNSHLSEFVKVHKDDVICFSCTRLHFTEHSSLVSDVPCAVCPHWLLVQCAQVGVIWIFMSAAFFTFQNNWFCRWFGILCWIGCRCRGCFPSLVSPAE